MIWMLSQPRREGVADGTTRLNGCNIPKLFGADFIDVGINSESAEFSEARESNWNSIIDFPSQIMQTLIYRRKSAIISQQKLLFS